MSSPNLNDQSVAPPAPLVFRFRFDRVACTQSGIGSTIEVTGPWSFRCRLITFKRQTSRDQEPEIVWDIDTTRFLPTWQHNDNLTLLQQLRTSKVGLDEVVNSMLRGATRNFPGGKDPNHDAVLTHHHDNGSAPRKAES